MRRWTLAAALTLAAVGIAPAWAGGHRSHAEDCHWTSPGGVSHGDFCVEPSCAAPCNAVPCQPAAAGCVPNATSCGPVAPECAAPATIADCTPACRSHSCYKPRKKSFLARLWELEKRKNACIADTFFDWVD